LSGVGTAERRCCSPATSEICALTRPVPFSLPFLCRFLLRFVLLRFVLLTHYHDLSDHVQTAEGEAAAAALGNIPYVETSLVHQTWGEETSSLWRACVALYKLR
jgi:hypothetical protein